MMKQSFMSEWSLPIFFCIAAFVVGVIWFVFIGHDILLTIDGTNKNTISWIDSQTECKWLKQYDTVFDVHHKWFKDSSDNELIKKMESLHC